MSHILVTGAAGGVGGALVEKLIARGDRVTGTVLDAEQEKAVAAQFGGQVAARAIDFSDPQRALQQLAALVAASAPIDGVAACAAISPYGPVETTPLDVFERALTINTVSQVSLFKAVIPALRETRGRIVFISSIAGKAGMPFIGAYVASKFALEGVADVMRREAAPQGVSVSLVEPGGIRTGMVEEQLRTIKKRIETLPADEKERYGYLYEGFQAAAASSYENTSSTPEEVADVVLEALTADEPKTRYMAGAEAEQLLGLAATASDAELDAAFRNMFGCDD